MTFNFEVFEEEYSYIESDTAELLGQLGFVLVGLDTPSVDHIRVKRSGYPQRS
jgi:kynurenine formamidase